jgi:phosphoenolpyruvate-protein phosphotransferase
MSSADTLRLLAPLAGWSTPLDEAPDEVFARRLLGEGVAIDPTVGTLHAPCDGEVVVLPASRHALTLRTAGGCELLLHVGIDTVALGGQGFEAHTHAGAQVRAGDALLSFDLELLARRARSVLTPVIVSSGSPWSIARVSVDRELAVGELLMELTASPVAAAATAAVRGPAAAAGATQRVVVGFEHGIHARPAALMAAALKGLDAEVRLVAHGREANARSTLALLALGVQHGEEVVVRAAGREAGAAVRTLAALLSQPGTAAVSVTAGSGTGARAPGEAVAAATTAVAVAGAQLRGSIASPGLAAGTAVLWRAAEVTVQERGAGVALERAALERALTAVRARLTRRAARGAGTAAETAGGIAAAHRQLLEDPELLEAVDGWLAKEKSAGFAWRQALRAAAARLESLPDARLAERAADLRDLETQLLVELGGGDTGAAPALPPQAVVLAHELLPSQLAALEGARPAGIAMAAGGATSHVAILAAALDIPMLVALGPAVLSVAPGTALVLDAVRGALEIDPGAARLAAVREAVAAAAARREALRALAQRPAHTADGVRIAVLANIGSLAEARAALANGAEGCGLLRTEFLFLERQSAPTQAEQTAAYEEIAAALGALPLTIRTLDAGGDKPIAYLPLPHEDNPALGLRGIRTSLAYPQLLRTQLRAVLALRTRGPCRLLLPMISEVAEVLAVRALLAELQRELPAAQPLEVGVMIETPAAALLADRLAAVADFLSIGTNDLTQYTLAMDRAHPQLAARLDALHPAVLRLIAGVAAGAHAHGRPVAMCGGLASEALAAPLLVGLGVHELSAVPAVIAQLKARLGRCTLAQCRSLAQRALEQADAAAVRALLADDAGEAPPS